MSRRSIRAYCPKCRHQQPFVRAEFFWKINIFLMVLTLGIWSICIISMIVKRWIWPWRCEHCGWHEPDFRSPEERSAGAAKVKPRSGMSESGRFYVKGGIQNPRPSGISKPQG